MAFDGLFTGKIADELNCAKNSHIDKIYQPSGDEICLVFRKKGFVKRLLISVKNGEQRVHFTDTKLENPEKPPMFCMLLRKYFLSARLLKAESKGFERLIEFTFEATNELGDRIIRKIVCELIGNMGNICLVDENGKIIDALRRSDLTAQRVIMPGIIYEYPKMQEKLDLKAADCDFILSRIKSQPQNQLSKAILDTVGGISPLVAREIVYKTGNEDKTVSEVKDFSHILEEIESLKTVLLGNDGGYMLIKDGKPFDFSYIPIEQYGNLCCQKYFENLSEMLDNFYRERQEANVKARITGDLRHKVDLLISRAEKRMALRQNELLSCGKREDLRIKGELIKANLGLIKAGQKSVRVQNFYDENLSEIEIELDTALSPQNNAAKYFKEYKKKNVAAVALKKFIEEDKEELAYLNSVAESIVRCETVADVAEIKQELQFYGYIKETKSKKGTKAQASTFKEYKSVEGYKILVGKNNIQNDLITTKMASKNDMWFHTKNIHGSHVVVFSGGAPISEETVVFAAKLAAKNSKASASQNVPVDYALVKYVKKPAGAKAGMVIYTDNKTVFVTPDRD